MGAFKESQKTLLSNLGPRLNVPVAMETIIGGAWKESVLATIEQSLWLDLLEEDVMSAEISFHEYVKVALLLAELRGSDLARANARAMHFAKSFVSAARRIWWVLETAQTNAFPPPIAKAIKEQRRKKKIVLRRLHRT